MLQINNIECFQNNPFNSVIIKNITKLNVVTLKNSPNELISKEEKMYRSDLLKILNIIQI